MSTATRRMLAASLHLLVALALTVLTQLGGIAWLASLRFRRRWLAFVAIYLFLMVAAMWTAPLFGRVPLSCLSRGPLQVQGWFYCLSNRNYVTPELADVLQQTAARVDQRYPGTVTMVLDGSFPFVTGFPLFPHLSHDDGEKADLAFFYARQGRYLPGATRSPVGYFAFEDGPSACEKRWPSLRWDLAALQPLWRDLDLDRDRTAYLITVLANDPRVAKIFVEPHLRNRLGVGHGKLRFQGCGAARHDDHIHLQL